MRVKHLAAGFVACAALVVASEATAGDLHRLSMPGNVEAATLDLNANQADLDADVTPTWYRRGWGWGGGFRGWGGGYRGFYGGGFRHGYWGGYRGFYGGYRSFYPRYYGGFYPRYYGGFYPRFYGGWYPRYYSSFYTGYSPITTYYAAYDFPCSTVTSNVVTVPAAPVMPRAVEDPQPGAKPAPGTFEYDGGPRAPIPMPKAGEESAVRNGYPDRPRIVNELFVSDARPATGKWVYPAYGEQAYRVR